MNSNQQKKQKPPNIIKKSFSPKGISPKGINKPIDTDRTFSFVPNSDSNTAEENYKDFIKIYNDYSKKQIDQTNQKFKKMNKLWVDMSDKEKHILFKKMVNDIFLTFQRDHRNIEYISHEFSQRELNMASVTARHWLKSIYDNKLIKKGPKTFQKDTEVCCDLDKNTYQDAVDKNNMCYEQLPEHLKKNFHEKTKTLHEKTKILHKKFGTDINIMDISLQVYKNIVKKNKLCSKYTLLKKIEKGTENKKEKNRKKFRINLNIMKITSPAKYFAIHKANVTNTYYGTKEAFGKGSMPKDLSYILEDTINGEIDKKYIPKFDEKETNEKRDQQIDEYFQYFIDSINDKSSIQKIQELFGFTNVEITVQNLEKLKEKIKHAYSYNSRQLSNDIELHYGSNVRDDIFIRNSTNICFPHSMKINVGTKTDKVIEDLLDKDVLYTAIENVSNENANNIRNIFINPSKDNIQKYILDYPYEETDSDIVPKSINISEDIYLHAYTFTDFLVQPDYQIYFQIWLVLHRAEKSYNAQEVKNISQALKEQHFQFARENFEWDDKIKKTKGYKLEYIPKILKIWESEFEWGKIDSNQLMKIVKEALINTLLDDVVFNNMNNQNFITYINPTINESDKKLQAEKIINKIFEICKKEAKKLNFISQISQTKFAPYKKFYNLKKNDYRTQWILKPKWIIYKYSRWGFMINNQNYQNKNINKPNAVKENNQFIKINKENKFRITYNQPDKLKSNPESIIYYVLKQCLQDKTYDKGMIIRVGINADETHNWYNIDGPEIKNDPLLSKSGKEYLYKEDYTETNHRNSLIIDTKNQEIEAYLFDMNNTQPDYIRGFISRALEKCETRLGNQIKFKRYTEGSNKYLVKVISGKTLGIPPKINFHGHAFDYVDGGICSSIAYYTLILWTKYYNIFGSFPELIKYIYNIIKKGKQEREFNPLILKNIQKKLLEEKFYNGSLLDKRNQYVNKQKDIQKLEEWIKNTQKTTLNSLTAYVDKRKLKLIEVNGKITTYNNIKSNKPESLPERLKKFIIKKKEEKVEIEKQIQEGENNINLIISSLESKTNNLVKNKNDLQKLELNIRKYLFKDQYLVKKKESIKLWNDFESGVITFMIFSKDLFENEIIQNYLKTKKDESMKKWAEDFNKKIKAGGSIKRKKKLSRTVSSGKKKIRKQRGIVQSGGKKKIRKHRGIVQSGGNKGKLKRGYKYTGKRLKNGLSEIKKVKAKK